MADCTTPRTFKQRIGSIKAQCSAFGCMNTTTVSAQYGPTQCSICTIKQPVCLKHRTIECTHGDCHSTATNNGTYVCYMCSPKHMQQHNEAEETG